MATQALVRPMAPRTLAQSPPAGLVRLAAFAALCLFGSLQWVRQVAPADTTAAVLSTLIATAAGGLVIVSGRRPAVIVAVAIVGLVGVVLASGLPASHLRPREWDALGSGINQGLTALPDLKVPYRGLDEWVRIVVVGGGGLLALIAALLACARRSPLAAAVVLATLYGVPIVEVGPMHPFLNGALFCVLLAALLWGDRVGIAQLPLAVTLALAAIVFGLALAPRLDAAKPWIDYQHLAGDLSSKRAVNFDWSHRYTPLTWPRRGDEVLRIKAPTSAYWKGVTLERFDGVHWRSDPRYTASAEQDTEMTVAHPEWRQTVTVVARHIRSRQLYAPGDVIRITALGRLTEEAPGGTRVIPADTRPLKPGDGYRATVYSPRPSPFELRTAGTRYPPWLQRETDIELPTAVGGPRVFRAPAVVRAPLFGQSGPIALSSALLGVQATGRPALLQSDYARVFRLAQSLRAGAPTPYALVQRVMRRVRSGATYTERPPAARLPLVDFVFGSRRGYCQQFSGAMTLLLRMAGIPARVAEGFAPGFYDKDRGEHVVRDYDAHSWVEVYFPQLGWVAFDPTPSSAPPASQAGDTAPSAAIGDSRDAGGTKRARPAPKVAAHDGGGSRVWLFVGVAVALVLVVALLVGLRARRGSDDGPRELAELRRALLRTGRAPTPQTTLQTIETGFAGDRDAQAYVRALRLARYGSKGDGPTLAQRAALRRALAAGLGLRGRMSAWLALPPRAAELRRSLRFRSYTR